MNSNILIIFPSGVCCDKNTNIQLYESTPEKHQELKAIVRGIGQYGEHQQYKSLNLFIQCDTRDLTMIESWSSNEDLFFEFAEFLSKELELEFDIYDSMKML